MIFGNDQGCVLFHDTGTLLCFCSRAMEIVGQQRQVSKARIHYHDQSEDIASSEIMGSEFLGRGQHTTVSTQSELSDQETRLSLLGNC